jgi:hypothetical protein
MSHLFTFFILLLPVAGISAGFAIFLFNEPVTDPPYRL